MSNDIVYAEMDMFPLGSKVKKTSTGEVGYVSVKVWYDKMHNNPSHQSQYVPVYIPEPSTSNRNMRCIRPYALQRLDE